MVVEGNLARAGPVVGVPAVGGFDSDILREEETVMIDGGAGPSPSRE
jgi:hypothetical protein